MKDSDSRPMVIVSKSEPEDACDKLTSYGLNGVSGEAGTDYVWYPHGKVYGIERKCVAPHHRVLRGDLTWVPAGELKPGDEVLSIEEYPRNSRPGKRGGMGHKRGWSFSKVVHNEITFLPAYEVEFSDGTKIVAAEDHPWLPYFKTAPQLRWTPTSELQIGMVIPRYLTPWETDTSNDAGYLAAAFDGEGCIAFTKSRPVWNVIFFQSRNSMLNRVRQILIDRGEDVREHVKITSSGNELVELHVKGGAAKVLSFIGSIRATRLIDVVRKKWLMTYLRPQDRLTITAIRPVGKRAMAAIEVEGGTYMVEGFAAHNTVTNLLQSLKDRQLVEQAHRGVEQFDRYFILIEGDYREGSTGAFEFHSPRHPESDASGWVQSGWRWDAIEGMLLDLSLLGAFYIRCRMFDYARKISQVVQSTTATSKAFIRERQRPQLPPSAVLGGKLYSGQIWALCALDGCGPKVAEALLSQYGTFAKAVQAMSEGAVGDVKTLGDKPRKIGPALTKRLHAAVNGF